MSIMFWEQHKNWWRKFESVPERDLVQQEIYKVLLPHIYSFQNRVWKCLDVWCWAWLFTAEIANILRDFEVYWIDKLYPFDDQIGQQYISYKQWNIDQWLPYVDREFSLCISKFVLMYLQDLQHHFKEVSRVLSDEWEYILVTFNPEYTLQKQIQLHKNNVTYGDVVEHEILGAGLKVKIILHSPDDYIDAIERAWMTLVEEEKIMSPNPRFDFAARFPFASIMRLRKQD